MVKKIDEKYNLGLVKGHYFINDYTELTSYCLDNYEELKDIKDCIISLVIMIVLINHYY